MKSAGQASRLHVEQNESCFLVSSLDLYSALELSCGTGMLMIKDRTDTSIVFNFESHGR